MYTSHTIDWSWLKLPFAGPGLFLSNCFVRVICFSGRLAVKNNFKLKNNHCNLYSFSSLSLQSVNIEIEN